MISKMGLLKQAGFAVCLVASVGAMPLAHADGFGISVATGPGYYNGGNYNGGYYNSGYYNRPANYAQRCVRDYYGEVVCRRAHRANYYNGAAYYNGSSGYNGYNGYSSYDGYNGYNGSYGQGVSLNYYGGRSYRGDDRNNYNTRDRDDDNRWQR